MKKISKKNKKQIPGVAKISEWFNGAVVKQQSATGNSGTKPTKSKSNESVEILIDDSNPEETNIRASVVDVDSSENGLINISDISFSLSTKWKIRGVVSFKYDIRRFHNNHGDGELFSFDIQDNFGEITIVSFNATVKSIEPRIEKNVTYEISDLCIRTSIDAYKTLPNPLQLTTTNKTTITEITPLGIIPTPYRVLKLEDLQTTSINSVIDIQCRVIRDYGLTTGITNEHLWTKRELLLIDDNNNQCRLTLWNNQGINAYHQWKTP